MAITDLAKKIDYVKGIELEEIIPDDLLEKTIRNWRKVYLLEKNQCPSCRRSINEQKSQKTVFEINESVYPFTIRRPLFFKLDRNDVTYVRTYRMIIYGMMQYSKSMKTIVMKAAGYNLGKTLVKKRAIRSLDDLTKIFVLQKIGILDIVKESLNNMFINLYECMSCYGMKYIGKTMCDFEAGVIEGVLEELYGRNITREKYCWGLGNHFCGFEVFFD